MKKVCSLVIAIMAFISCFIFTACGDKYKNLKMSFYSLEGDSLSEINLTIDDYDDINLESTRVAVRFDGISDKDIGNVDVKSSPLELADISNATLDGNKYYFDVTAVRANKGSLVVTHLASNKKVSIPLNINRKSNGLELKTDTYITKISNNDRQLILNAGQIVNLLPSNELCTDKVYFKSVTKNLPSGITFVEETVGENNFITGININSSVKNGSEIILYPVTVLQGYENTEYSAKTFKVKFVDEILESNTVISTDSYHKDYVNQEIILITNDFTTNTTTTGETYAYNNFNFELNYLLGDEVVGLGDIDGINYYDYYDIQFDYDRDLIYDPVLDGTKITIQAKDYMDASSVVIVRLQPKVAGDLSSIEKVIKIKGEVKPTDFNVTMQGKNIDISENIDLFNFYVSPNALGEVFTFSTIPDYALNSMQAMRIKISPALLNAKINVGDSIEGVNKVYTDDTFTNEFEGSSYTDGDNNIVYSFRNNKYVLEFYISTSAMKFYFDTDEKMLVSQLIYDTDSVYIRYSETNILTDEALSFNLTAVYDGDLLYLKDIRGVSRTLNFNHNEGIYDVKYNAGELQPKGVTYESSLYVDHNNIAYIVDDVYLDRKQGKNNLSANAYLLYLARENVIGEDLSPVSSAKLRIEVTGGNDNPLKIKQYSSVDGNGKNVTGSTLIEEFNYSATGGLNSIILLIFDQDTDIGEYTITLSSKNGYTKSIKCLVYEEISVEDLSFDIPTNDKLFKNDDFKLNYDCDYIVESGVKAELVLNVPNYAKNNILSYDFNATLNTDNVNSYIKLDTQTMQINSVLLTFLRGTYISYINDYITLTMSVNVPKYSNIIHQDGYNTLSISTKFFIYDKINDTDININHPTLTRYMSRYLGAYDVDDAKANLEVSVRDDNLWNYVQSYLQLPSSNLEKDEIDNNEYKVVWYTENGTSISVIGQQDRSIDLEFSGNGQGYYKDIYARVRQFNREIVLRSRVTVNRPIITEQVVIRSEVEKVKDAIIPILNLKAGESYQMVADNLSSNGGKVTNPDIYMVVVDGFGNVNSNSVLVDNAHGILTVSDRVSLANGLRVIVFAKDALKQNIDNMTSGFNNPSSFMLDSDGIYDYSNAYVEIELVLSDGSVGNPYAIFDADDFWQINSNYSMLDKHFRLMTDIDIRNTTIPVDFTAIDGFSGSIESNYTISNGNTQYFNYTIYGLELNEYFTSLFTNFRGVIRNINFEVDYGYKINANGNYNLGLFAENSGSLENVSVIVSGGESSFNSCNVNFGTLVGLNTGYIRYTDDSIIGSRGSINVEGDARVNLGGLVGRNEGSIVGAYKSPSVEGDDKVEFVAYIEDEGAVVSLDLSSTLTNTDSTLGGVVGLNALGSLANLYVSGQISATNDNVGGVIGVNDNERTDVNQKVSISLDNAELNGLSRVDYEQISNIKSAVVIKADASDNVGGVVGKDNYGRYKECHYQILSNMNTAIVANDNVGGIVGYSRYGWFEYCSVMSYRWDYKNMSHTFDGYHPDILAHSNVGGIVGSAVNDIIGSINDGDEYSNVAIVKSSVNAYIKAETNVGGLQSNSTGGALVQYAYFVGKLDAKSALSDNLIDNDNESIVNNVYAVNNSILVKYINVSPTEMPTGDIWGLDNNLNGGYVYIRRENSSSPLFDVVPSKIVANIKKDAISENSRIIHIDYYEFNMNDNLDVVNASRKANSHRIEDYFDFEVEPSGLGSVRLIVESSRPSILNVVGNDLVVYGVGEVTLTFRSVLNHSITDSVTIVITRPIGDKFVLSNNGTDINDSIFGTTQGIAKDKTRQYYVVSSGTYNYFDNLYSYQTNDKVNLEIDVSVADGKELENNQSILDILSISGVQGSLDDATKVMRVNLSYEIPFSIKVLKNTDVKFVFTVTPYITINDTNLYYRDKAITFYLVTSEGASDISLNYESAVLYPNDITHLSAVIVTDRELDGNALNSMLDVKLDGNVIDKENLSSYITLSSSEYDENKGVQKLDYVVKCNENVLKKTELDLTFRLTSGKKTNVKFTLLPQRINKIDVKNYVYKDKKEGQEIRDIERKDVLKAGYDGLMIIDLAPINGYYDYLEISDITGGEEITFSQIDGVDGNRLGKMDEISHDGKGIKLYKQSNSNSLYVSTRIDNRYSSKLHTIKVSAFITGGIQVSNDFLVEIDVRMLPEINIRYQDPRGVTSEQEQNIYLANGVDAKLLIDTRNSNGNIDYEMILTKGSEKFSAEEYFELVESSGRFYDLISIKHDNNLLGATLTINVSTTSTGENGDYDIATDSISFKIVNFVIHNVSVTRSTPDGNAIYGNYGVPYPLEFTFKGTDISFNDGGSVWAKEYVYDSNINDIDSTKGYINKILGILNTNSKSVYVVGSNEENIVLEQVNNKWLLTVNESELGSTASRLMVNLYLHLNDGYNWDYESEKDETLNQNPELEQISINKSYALQFTKLYADDEADLIKNEADFISMESNDNAYYILGQDIELNDYSPLDVRFRVFDGNGHKITIKSFAAFDDSMVYAGLFKQIYEGMIVINLEVEYKIGEIRDNGRILSPTYVDLCPSVSEVDYTSVLFGGITPRNDGIISNTKVTGTLAVRASLVENKITDYAIDMNIGGLVGENAETGYITNSTSRLKISALANIGGLVYTNSGKIVSCAFDADTEQSDKESKGLIYAYNNNVANSAIINVGGFIVENAGEISMSYVKSGIYKLSNNSTIGCISVKDVSSGFVFTNNGNIKDCYADIEKVGENINNIFSGFVNSNSGSISNTYTIINRGDKTSAGINMFAPVNTTGISNSYEIKLTVSGYSNNVKGLDTIDYTYRYRRDKYPAFMFGDNNSSVWTIRTGETPKLVSTEEEVEYTENESPSGDSVVVNGDTLYKYYHGLRDIERIDTPIVSDNGENLGYSYSWKILDNNYGTKANPILLYDVENSWNRYMLDGTTNYFRLIADIEFGNLYTYPLTSERVFSGNIQGNNMSITNLMIYTSTGREAIGLFKSLTGVNDRSIVNAVRNITVSATSIQATKTETVGVMAGIIEDFNLYNINVEANSIIVGGNAVGGLAGVIRGVFDIENITSNVGANSTRSSSQYRYNIYTSVNNGVDKSNNIESVYYAGSVAGILDAYDNSNYDMNITRDIEKDKYYSARKISVSKGVTLIGDTVGTLFGLITERVKLLDSSVNLDGGNLHGVQYSAGLVGENRGYISNSHAECESDNVFNGSLAVSAGLVGLNLGGFVDNSYANVNIVNVNCNIVAGLIGRNIEGYVRECSVDANLIGRFTGGIIGADYLREDLISYSSGFGAITANSYIAVPAPTKNKPLYNNATKIENVLISSNAIEYWFENMGKFYTYPDKEDPEELQINYRKVLGLIVGLSSNTRQGFNLSIKEEGDIYYLIANEKTEGDIYLISSQSNIFEVGKLDGLSTLIGGVQYPLNIEAMLIKTKPHDFTYITYIVGSQVPAFDSWSADNYYSNSMLIFMSSSDSIKIEQESV